MKPGFRGWIPWPVLALGLLVPGIPVGDRAPSAGEALLVSQEDVYGPVAADLPGEGISSPRAEGEDPGDGVLPLLQRELLRMVETPGWRSAQWGVLAVGLERGDTLVSIRSATPMAPASNLKLLTSALALEELGEDFRFPTFLLADGPIRDGVLHGDLILYGTGDPTLQGGSETRWPEGALGHFLEVVREAGIREVRGSIVGDGTFFQGDLRRPSWNPDDLNDWFAAPASALSFNENMVTLRLSPGVVAGAPARLELQPFGARVPVRNYGRTVDRNPSPSLLLVRDDPEGEIRIEGEIHRNGRDVWRSVTVSDPPAYAAAFLMDVLVRNGIAVTGPVRSSRMGSDAEHESRITGRGLAAPALVDGGAPRTLAVHHSPPLPTILDMVNKRSHNLYAELLLFTLGHLREGEPTFEGGAQALTRFLVEEVGIPEEEFHIEDGSGLSRLNRSSPGALVSLMRYMADSPRGEVFWASLPEAGNRRELRRMDRSAAAGNLRAKTGTIHRTSALSGIVYTADGEPVLFSIMVNGVPSPWAAKRVEDQIGIRLASFSRPTDGLRLGEEPGSLAAVGGSGEGRGAIVRD